jgi:hypothetical protein
MRNILEQAGAARQAASEIRRHMTYPGGSDTPLALKDAERLEARAAELEYRWLIIPPATHFPWIGKRGWPLRRRHW